jgi:nitrogen fixation/metabolism regulation signal transduction histidine kinase
MFPKSYKDIRLVLNPFREFFRTPLFQRLSTRLLLTLTLLAALPLIIVGLFMTSVTQESLSEYVRSQHSEIAGPEMKLIYFWKHRLPYSKFYWIRRI